MSITAKKVLDRAESLGMLDPKVIAELRKQVAESKFSVSAEAIVKILVDKKLLTTFQAKKLVADVTEEPATVNSAPAASTSVSSTKGSKTSGDEDLLLLDDIEPKRSASSVAPSKADDEEVVDLEAALPPPQPVKAAVKPIPEKASNPKPANANKPATSTKPVISPKSVETKKPEAPSAEDEEIVDLAPVEPTVAKAQPDPQARPAPAPISSPSAPTTVASPGLTPLGPAAPVQPAVTSDLMPMSPAGAPGLTPLGGGLTPLDLGEPLGADASSGLAPPPPPKEENPNLAKKRGRGWDNPILLIGGGGLGVLVIAFVILYLALTRGSAQEMFDEAVKQYRAGSYASAIDIFSRFVAKYPDDPTVSSARVKIGMARVRQFYDGESNMTQALEAAQTELPALEAEPQFDEARAELESMLPSIADYFATRARAATNVQAMQKELSLAKDAMKLVNNASYLPTGRRQQQEARIDEIEEKIRVAERAINQDNALTAAMTELQEKLKGGDIVAAYSVRETLLQEYPTLQNHSEVVKNTLAISQRERALATSGPESKEAATDDLHRQKHRIVTLAKRSGESLGGTDRTVYLQLRGTLYALEASSGKNRWRRFVNFAAGDQPIPLPGRGVLAADPSRNELLLLAESDGKAVWRQPIAEPFLAPQVLEEHVFVTTKSGKVLRISADSGAMDYAAQLPQQTNVGPGIDSRAKTLLQVGQHSTIFTLAATDGVGEPLSCLTASYLGHDQGSVVVPPVTVSGHVFVCENTGSKSSVVHVLAADPQGKLDAARKPITLRGRVVVAPITSGRRLVVVSDLGDVAVVDVDAGNAESPVTVTASMIGGLNRPTIGYPMLNGPQLYIGDMRLAEYDIVSTRQVLDRTKSSFDGDTFVAPLQMFGDVLVHARQRAGSSSVVITGTNLSTNKSWQTTLASPVASLAAFPQKRTFAAVNSDGDLFEVTVDDFSQGLREGSISSAAGTLGQSLTSAISLPDNRSLLLEQAGKRWILHESKPGGRVERIEPQLPESQSISASPVAFAGGALAPLSGGSIWLFDPVTGAAAAGTTPFQPEISADAKVKWLSPVVVNERQFVAIDAARRVLYLVRREEKPSPFLAESRKLELDYEPVFAAISGTTLLVVARGEMDDEIQTYSLPSLELVAKTPVSGRISPYCLESTGQNVFVITGEKLLHITGDAVKWQVDWKEGPLATAPIKTGEDWLLVARNGKLIRAGGESGELTEAAQAGQPIVAAQSVGSGVIAGGADGTLHLLSASTGEK